MTQERHLSSDSFGGYLAQRVPMEHPIDGDPRMVLFFDPGNSRIGLRGPARVGETTRPSELEHLTVSTVHHGGMRMIEIAVTSENLFADAYPVLCGVADRVQLDSRSVTAALAETLRQLGHLIRPGQSLTREAETGLIGELLLFAGLVSTTSPEFALAAWRGGSEEHDFGLTDLDVEVKTTTSENRIHRISSLGQLEPTGDRPLWLLSVQLTPAGSDGVTLADLIRRIRRSLPSAALRDDFDTRAQAGGWRHRYADTPLTRWRLRSEPAWYAVSGGFPQLTTGLLTGAGVDLSSIIEVRYRLNLAGRSTDPPPATLDTAVSAGRKELR